MSELTALDALRMSKEALLSKTWVKHMPNDERNESCAVWPLISLRDQMAARPAGFALDRAASHLFRERVVPLCPGGLRPAASVNDHPDTTFNDVMAMYDEAERILKERA